MTREIKIGILAGFVSGVVGALVVVFIICFSLASHNSAWFEQLMARLGSGWGASLSETQAPFIPETAQEVAVVSTVERATPAVVSIVITKDVPIIERYYEESPFFFGFPQFRENGTERREVGGGSGFLVSADGLIVTNRHVVSAEDADYTAFTNDGKQHEARIIARDPVNDLAIIKIEGSSYPHLSFGDSDAIKVGQSVIAIGNALSEFRNTVSVGVVSGLARSITAGDGRGMSELLEGVIQTDAAINPGNSGGPLLNLRGEVIGVNVAVAQGSENIGFALPSKLAQSVVTSVTEHGRIVRPFLGVRYIPITEEVKEKNSLTVDYGALVARGEGTDDVAVLPGSPADKAGVVENDIILEVDGKRIDSDTSLANVIRQKNVGDTVELKLLSKGAEKTLTVTLEEIDQ